MKILIAGANGQVGKATGEYSRARGYETIALGSKEMDITNSEMVAEALAENKPDFVVNCAAYTAVDKAEDDAKTCQSINVDGPANLATHCHRLDIPLIHLSTDYVFDGETTAPYLEEDETLPTGVYGQTKLDGENLVRQFCPKHIILRVSWVFGENGNNFLLTMVRLAEEKEELKIVADQQGGPTYSGDIARVVIAMIEQLNCKTSHDLWGTYHYCGSAITNWHHFASVIIDEAKKYRNIICERVIAISTTEFPTKAKRPKNSVLNCNKILENFGINQRPWRLGVVKSLQVLFSEPLEND